MLTEASLHFAPQRRAFLLILAAFGFFGLTFGVWLVLLADLQRALGLSPGALGAALTAGLAASLPAMMIAGRLADRRGAGGVITAAAVMMGLALLGVAVVTSYSLLLGLLFLFYGATGAFDVGINAAAMSFEGRTGRRVIAYFHAAFSGFAALGALSTGALIALGVPFGALYLTVAVGLMGFAGVVWRSHVLPHQPSREAPARGEKGSSLYRSPALLLLALITALAFLCEGELGNWAAIYLRSSLELPAVLGAFGVAVFHGAMLVGRLAAAQAARRFSRCAILRVSGVVVASGMLLSLATSIPAVILSGFLIVGLALSGVAPLAFSLAGDIAPERLGEASSVITTVGYSGFLLGPVLVGVLAEVVGLQLALLTIVVAGGLVAVSGLWVAERGELVAE